MRAQGRILVVDDYANTRLYLKTLLTHEGYVVFEAGTGREALEILKSDPLPAHRSAILLDLKLPDTTGIELVEPIRALYPHVPVVIMTAHATVETAVEAIRKGAANYLEKPIDEKKLLTLLGDLTSAPKRTEKDILSGNELPLPLLAGDSPAIRRLADRIRKASSHSIPILITGESGTGKELVARSIHQLSPRREEPFIAVNTGAISRELVNSELFGHEKGSFTSALSRKDGWLSTAGRGTLFLDEIGTMDLSTQIALLRVLENRTFYRVGGTEELSFHARIIGASNIDPLLLVNQGRLREDLYYRMNVFPINVPPLRERGGDILILARRFLAEAFDSPGLTIGISPQAREILTTYPWPGNVRELKNRMIEVAVVQGLTGPDHFELEGEMIAPLLHLAPSPGSSLQPLPPRTLKEGEREQIRRALAESKGNKSLAARILGISRKALYAKMREYEIEEEEG
ncbi:MAG: sigma-54 dependent transcriptional regulator [Nitrospiraceae bacterium]|nr:sigma-54 dependent transcriptional regulator [Nitrospiraceae bacterium]